MKEFTQAGATTGPATSSECTGTETAEAPTRVSGCATCGAEHADDRCTACGVAREAGGFSVLRMLHESDHARVYLARAGAGGPLVALKELLFSRAPDAAAIEAFEREALLLRQLSHPSIPRFMASFRAGAGAGLRLCLAQEFVEGDSLAKTMEHGRHDEAAALRILRGVLPILRYLHGLSPPLVHRDVKPHNLIIKADGSVSLVDFGSAREVAPRGTHHATVTGTFGYMPPEALGGTLDRTADLYGLGATLVYLLSRRPPDELLWPEPRPLLSRALNVSPGLIELLERLTARNRAARFQSVEEVEQALASLEPARAWQEGTVAPRAKGADLRPSTDRTPNQDRLVPLIFAAPILGAVLTAASSGLGFPVAAIGFIIGLRRGTIGVRVFGGVLAAFISTFVGWAIGNLLR